MLELCTWAQMQLEWKYGDQKVDAQVKSLLKEFLKKFQDIYFNILGWVKTRKWWNNSNVGIQGKQIWDFKKSF